MDFVRQSVPAEDPEAEGGRLEEDREQTLHRQLGTEHVTDQARVLNPCHPKLKLLQKTCHDTEDKVDEVGPPPEVGHPKSALVTRAHP